MLLGWTAFGCGDDVVCPTGTAGSPCRYTTGAGVPPPLLPSVDVSGADASDGEVTVPDASPDTTQDPGDIEVLDEADLNQGPDAISDVDDADSDANADAE